MPADMLKTLFIVWLGVAKCSGRPGSQENGRHPLYSLASDKSVEEITAEYDEDEFHDYYLSTPNFNENSREFVESWSTEVFGSLKEENGTMVGGVPGGNFSADTSNRRNPYNKTRHISVEHMSENHRVLLLQQLQSSLNLGSTIHVETPGHQQPMIPPQFMTDLYQTVTDPQTGITVRANPHEAEQVWSILETNPSVPGLFQFDVSNIGHDALIEAELHVYRIGGFDSSLLTNRPPYYLLRVYQVMPSTTASNNALVLHPADVHQLLNVHYVSAFGTGWQVFKVTRAVESWRNDTSPNLGLLITATTILNEPVDVRFSRKHQNSANVQPSLILFTNHPSNGNSPSGYSERHTESTLPQQGEFNGPTDVCSLKSLHVNFTKLGWSTFIVSPTGFPAYQCTGACNWPMTTGHYATNHALVRSALLNIGYDAVSPVCCVPTALEPISVLYKDETGNFRLRRMDNMVVRKCACR